jgi:hypothetical protein
MPPIPVSEVAGLMADVSEAGAASFLCPHPANRTIAVSTRSVFIVISSEKVGGGWAEARREGTSRPAIVKMN